MQVDPAIAERFASHLEADERILWAGRQGKRESMPFLPILVVVGIIVFGFFWLRPFITDFSDFRRAPGIFGYFPFIFIGAFVLSFIKPLLRALSKLSGSKSDEYYAVTNKRALAANARGGFKAALIGKSPYIDKWTNKNGVGHVLIGNTNASAASLNLTSIMGGDQFSAGGQRYGATVAFLNIPQAAVVYNLINEQIPAETLARIDAGEAVEIAPDPQDTEASNNVPTAYLPPPPRSVPWHVAATAIFANALAQFGWVFFGFGLIFFWIFAAQADFSAPVFWGGVDVLPGKIIASETTGCSSNDMEVYKFAYSYTDSMGMTHHGVSYSSQLRYNPGDACSVEVAKLNRSLNRIQGGGRAPFGMGTLFVVIFPLIGLLIIIATVRGGLKSINLLKNGYVAYGKYTHAKKTNTEVNDQPVYNLFFKFRTADGRVCEMHTSSSAPDELRAERQPMIIYDPSNPKNAELMDNMSVRVRMTGDGSLELREGHALWVLLSFLIPLATIIGHGRYIYNHFIK